MASSAGMALARASNAAQYSLLREPTFMLRALTNVQFNRHRKRTCKPPRWFVAKKANTQPSDVELTPQNRQFLKEVFEDKYIDIAKRTSPLQEAPWERQEWDIKTMRTGVLGIKIGVIPQWDKNGKKFYTTLIQILDNHVIRYTPPEEFKQSMGFKPKWKKRVASVVVGALSSDPLQYTSNYVGLFKEAGVPPKRKLTRFLVTENAAIQPGTPLLATHFRVGDYVDVQAKTIGHGFQGVVKRWGFKGGPASHGTTKFHRRPGNIGQQGTAKVWKGKKLPGHMGMDWVTLRGLKIWRINTKYNVLYVQGPGLPGPNHCYIRIMDSSLYHRQVEMLENTPYMPTFYPDEDAPEGLPEELFDKDLHQFTEPSIKFEEEKGK